MLEQRRVTRVGAQIGGVSIAHRARHGRNNAERSPRKRQGSCSARGRTRSDSRENLEKNRAQEAGASVTH